MTDPDEDVSAGGRGLIHPPRIGSMQGKIEPPLHRLRDQRSPIVKTICPDNPAAGVRLLGGCPTTESVSACSESRYAVSVVT